MWCKANVGFGLLLIYYPLNSVVLTEASWVNIHSCLSAFKLFVSLASDTWNSSASIVIIAPKKTGDNSKTIIQHRCRVHLGDFDRSQQRWWCGLSGVGVKATSDPWLTWKTPTTTTVSSEKWLCGYVQSLESTSHITASPISNQENGGADISREPVRMTRTLGVFLFLVVIQVNYLWGNSNKEPVLMTQWSNFVLSTTSNISGI